jgi:hypothetical protein
VIEEDALRRDQTHAKLICFVSHMSLQDSYQLSAVSHQ